MNKELKIFITGYSGQLGFDCYRVLKEKGYTNIYTSDISDLDITDKDEVIKKISNIKPDIIFHNAAYTSVDKAEVEKDLAYRVNALAPLYIAEAAKIVGAKLFYISTDYVFDGKGNIPFEVDSQTNPISNYGKTKLEGEKNVIKTLNNYFILRTSWVFGINGNNFIKSMIKLAQSGKKEINVVCDQVGSPTYSYDLATLMVEMMETNKYGIYHSTNEGFTSWAGFASFIFKECNYDIKVNSVTTKEYLKLLPNQAIRPLNSRLSKNKLVENGFNLLPTWQDATKRFIKEFLKRKIS